MKSSQILIHIVGSAVWLGLHTVAAKGPVSTKCPASSTSATPTSTCTYGAPSTPTGTAPPLYKPTTGTAWEGMYSFTSELTFGALALKVAPPESFTGSSSVVDSMASLVVYTHNDGDVIKPSSNYSVYDLDISDPNTKAIKSANKKLICYFSAGTSEDFRDDIGCFKPADTGCGYGGDFPNEHWVDYTSTNVRNIMLNRMDRAKKLGCDAIDPDNLDAYNNVNGLGLTMQDSIDYIKFLSQAAHARGLSIGIKNAPDLIPYITSGSDADVVQFAVVEQCISYDECDSFQALVDQNKPVFNIEYRSDANGDPLEGSKNKNKDWSLAEQKAVCNKWAAIKKGTNGNPPELLSTVLKHYPDVDGYFTRTCPNVYA